LVSTKQKGTDECPSLRRVYRWRREKKKSGRKWMADAVRKEGKEKKEKKKKRENRDLIFRLRQQTGRRASQAHLSTSPEEKRGREGKGRGKPAIRGKGGKKKNARNSCFLYKEKPRWHEYSFSNIVKRGGKRNRPRSEPSRWNVGGKKGKKGIVPASLTTGKRGRASLNSIEGEKKK